MKCPNCGHNFCVENEIENKCAVQGCLNEAVWEGWYKCKDPIFGEPTGLSQRRCVCDEHKSYWRVENEYN